MKQYPSNVSDSYLDYHGGTRTGKPAKISESVDYIIQLPGGAYVQGDNTTTHSINRALGHSNKNFARILAKEGIILQGEVIRGCKVLKRTILVEVA